MNKRQWVLVAGTAIACAAAAVLSSEAQAEDKYAYVGATLFGDNETAKGAGDDAGGNFSAELNLTKGSMCYMLEVDGLDKITMAHIHEGAEGSDGPVVVPLEVSKPGADDTCMPVDKAVLEKIAKSSKDFYVNVHNEDFPAGAIRGQFGDD